MHAFGVFNEYEKSQWHLFDIPWDELDPATVKPEIVNLVRSMLMGECNVIPAMHGFLNESVDDYDFATYVANWGYQEVQHHFALKTWLTRVGADVSEDVVEAIRPPYPPGITHAATLATNIISELSACHLYQKISTTVEEPVLRRIATLASQDEARHAREFLFYTQRRLTRRPEELASVLETVYVYIADPVKLVKHPVSVFKSELPQLKGHETIDDGIAYYLSLDGDHLERLRRRVFSTFSTLTGFELENPASIRRALRAVWDQHQSPTS